MSQTVPSATSSKQRQEIGKRAAKNSRRRSSRSSATAVRNVTPTAASVALAGDVVAAVRIDDGDRRRKLRADLVMVEHDDIDAARLRVLQRLEAGRAAIDADDQRRALRRQACRWHPGSVRSPRRCGPEYRCAAPAQARKERHGAPRPRSRRRHHSRRRSQSARAPPRHRRAAPPPHPCLQASRDRAGLASARRKIGGRAFHSDAARREHPRQALRSDAALRDRRGDRLAARVEPARHARPVSECETPRKSRSSVPIFSESQHRPDYGPGSAGASIAQRAFIQRRNATPAQTISTTPNGQAPLRKP